MRMVFVIGVVVCASAPKARVRGQVQKEKVKRNGRRRGRRDAPTPPRLLNVVSIFICDLTIRSVFACAANVCW